MLPSSNILFPVGFALAERSLHVWLLLRPMFCFRINITHLDVDLDVDLYVDRQFERGRPPVQRQSLAASDAGALLMPGAPVDDRAS